MENYYENKELLKEAAKQSLESLKDLKPGTDEYTNTAKMALQLYDMQLKSDEQERNQNLKEDEERRKGQEVINDQERDDFKLVERELSELMYESWVVKVLDPAIPA